MSETAKAAMDSMFPEDSNSEKFTNDELIYAVITCLNGLSKALFTVSKSKGFWQEGVKDSEKIALIHSEVSEMLETLRQNGKPTQSKKIPGFLEIEEEAADVIIRVLDFCGAHNLNIGEAIIAKHEYNKTREYKHGKRF